jgi:hypothetical protein
LHIIHKWKDKRPITNVAPNGQEQFDTYEPLDELTAENLTWKVRSDVYAKAPVTQATKRQQADKLMQMQGQFNFNPPIITPEEWIQFQDFDDKEDILQRMEADRLKMQAEDIQAHAQIMSQVASEIQKMRAQGLPEQEIMNMAQEVMIGMLQQNQTEAMKNGRPRDAQAQSQAPQGVTNQVAMSNMTNGS